MVALQQGCFQEANFAIETYNEYGAMEKLINLLKIQIIHTEYYVFGHLGRLLFLL